MIEIRNVKVPVQAEWAEVIATAARKLKLPRERILSCSLRKRSVDARKKPLLFYVMTLILTVNGDEHAILQRAKCPDAAPYRPPAPLFIKKIRRSPQLRPIVCGAGPAGLFAALTLAEAGAAPIVLERGRDAAARLDAIERFHKTGLLDPESNIQFGEGGAGTFSDGKLTTNIHDPRCAHVLETFVKAGAPEELLWQAKPHIGTDLLPGVIQKIRARILRAGGDVRFETRLCDIVLKDGRLSGIVAAHAFERQEIPSNLLILATGHSARDVFEMLYRHGAALDQKPFSIGVRIEHPQRLINAAQYGCADHPIPGAADYKLACHLEGGRSVYTFCMCPGGEVVAAASEPGGVVTNGMSRFARDGENANSALLVNVVPQDFGSGHPLAGVAFQRQYEAAAFAVGGRNFTAPAQLLGDFMQGVPSSAAGSVLPTYPLGLNFCDLSAVLPSFAVESMRRAVPIFDAHLHGFAMPDAVLTGVETRSSSPVRIVRDDNMQSNLNGIFPCGEGAGYAGGIMSAAVDGIRVAQAVLSALES